MIRNRNEGLISRLVGYFKIGFIIGIVLLIAQLIVNILLGFIIIQGISFADIAALSLGEIVGLMWIALIVVIVVHIIVAGIVISVVYEHGQEAGWW